jgi:AcrR family transcriptional regulator
MRVANSSSAVGCVSIDSVTSSVLSVNTNREARLLDAAARLFARFGFDKTSIDEIARAAGVSKGAVYLHWSSKDILFEATLIREGLRLQNDIRGRIEADPAGGTLAAIYRHSIVALEGNPLLLAALTFDARVLGDYLRRQDPSISRQRLAFGEEFVRRMQAANLMRAELEPGVTAYIMTVISFGLLGIRQLAPALPAPSFERLADALADLLDRGLATHGVANASADAGKQAFHNLTEETRQLYRERTEAASGSHHSPRSHN